jgi:hypothetical protein
MVARSYSVSEAMVIQSMLAWHGVHSALFDVNYANADPGMMIALGGVRVMVFAPDAELARALIWDGKEESIPPRSYHRNPILNGIMAIFFLCWGVPPPARVPLQKS